MVRKLYIKPSYEKQPKFHGQNCRRVCQTRSGNKGTRGERGQQADKGHIKIHQDVSFTYFPWTLCCSREDFVKWKLCVHVVGRSEHARASRDAKDVSKEQLLTSLTSLTSGLLPPRQKS